ncbi:MAG: glutamate-5-semialdehyde dehydrogenase [Parvibaculaceae bacterium]|jgi:glutamate-5-semialdehyde dehydrogenase|nr:glutamate-5-semialdehyde dehydrogenase [Parvibaculaceae bacterium]
MSVVTLTATQEEVAQQMAQLGTQARAASNILSTAPTKAKDAALLAAAMTLRANVDDILAANKLDMDAAIEKGLSGSMLDRLKLDSDRIEAIAKGMEDIAGLKDPVGDVIANWDRPNGLNISRVRTPLGVIGVIFESRPNVTADAGALCLKAGNAAILRAGSESFHSSRAIHACLVEGLTAASLPEHAIQLVPTRDRAAVGEMLRGLDHNIDVIIPRGGHSLVARVQAEARVPVFAHLDGICHVYIDKDADIAMARDIAVNSKMRRTGICGAAETLLVDRAAVDTHLTAILIALMNEECEIRGDDEVLAKLDMVTPATKEDWSTEYLDAVIAVRIVDGVNEAIEHIATFGSHHTDSIVTNNEETAAIFLNEVDSAIVLHNASTQFADGGEFGMGAEIGIATGKFHARGPVGVEQLTSFKYQVRGQGQTRP